MNKTFKEYIKDLEHIKDYWEKQEETKQLSQQTTITIIMGVLVLLAKLLAGVPA